MAQVPYEFLIRWNHLTGGYQGSHVKTYDTVTMREGDAQSVAIGTDNGFPLALVLTAIEQGAIIAADKALADLLAEKEASTALATSKDAEIAALQSRIKELEAAP